MSMQSAVSSADPGARALVHIPPGWLPLHVAIDPKVDALDLVRIWRCLRHEGRHLEAREARSIASRRWPSGRLWADVPGPAPGDKSMRSDGRESVGSSWEARSGFPLSCRCRDPPPS